MGLPQLVSCLETMLRSARSVSRSLDPPHRGMSMSCQSFLASVGPVAFAALALSACAPGSSADGPVSVARPELPRGGQGGSDGAQPPEPGQTEDPGLYERPPPPGCGDFKL